MSDGDRIYTQEAAIERVAPQCQVTVCPAKYAALMKAAAFVEACSTGLNRLGQHREAHDALIKAGIVPGWSEFKDGYGEALADYSQSRT